MISIKYGVTLCHYDQGHELWQRLADMYSFTYATGAEPSPAPKLYIPCVYCITECSIIV